MNKKYIYERAILITYGLLVYFLLINFENVLKGSRVLIDVFLPVILGGAFAFIFNIPMSFLEKKLTKILNKLHFKERTIFMISIVTSLSVVVIIFIGVTIISINIIIPQVVHSFYTILEKVPSNIKELENFLKDNIKNVSLIEWISTKVGQVDGNIVNILNNISKSILGGIIDISLGITASIINSILGIIIAIYILLDKEKLKRQLKLFIYRISNDKYNKLTSILKLTYYKLRRYIGGQAIDAT
ncbi:AI-2E family transporter [Clostridium cuniculi]|uniref:AI-2E family transporter n=1 Tax=Clostridium cuniculi TaxID=2548455 RepID=UPI00105601F4|nr:AI-2E family transporter [Clostridium cuniculi]